MREASSNLAVAEATATILRGHADAMLAGATGGKIHPTRTIHAFNQEEIAVGNGDPSKLIRPFDNARNGMVLGEGAAAILLEELASAQTRGATIWGEVIGFASSAASDQRGTSQLKTSFRNVIDGALASAQIEPADVGHIHAHGLGTRRCDAEEAQAIAECFALRPDPVPVVAAKSYFGNLGAAGGLVELIASLLAQRSGRLFRTLNYDSPDPECPVNVVTTADAPPGDVFLNLSISPQGQSSAVVIRRFAN
jgi:3-oxoacyl-[acyl-carrier-protein] synthase II